MAGHVWITEAEINNLTLKCWRRITKKIETKNVQNALKCCDREKKSPHKQRIDMQWGLIDLNRQRMWQVKVGLKLVINQPLPLTLWLTTKWQFVWGWNWVRALRLNKGSGTCQGLDIYCFRLWWAAVSGLCEQCAEGANSLVGVVFFQFTVLKQPHRFSDHIRDDLFFVHFVSNGTRSLVCSDSDSEVMFQFH